MRRKEGGVMCHLSQLQGLLGKRERRGASSEPQGDDCCMTLMELEGFNSAAFCIRCILSDVS